MWLVQHILSSKIIMGSFHIFFCCWKLNADLFSIVYSVNTVLEHVLCLFFLCTFWIHLQFFFVETFHLFLSPSGNIIKKQYHVRGIVHMTSQYVVTIGQLTWERHGVLGMQYPRAWPAMLFNLARVGSQNPCMVRRSKRHLLFCEYKMEVRLAEWNDRAKTLKLTYAPNNN